MINATNRNEIEECFSLMLSIGNSRDIFYGSFDECSTRLCKASCRLLSRTKKEVEVSLLDTSISPCANIFSCVLA